MGSMGALLVRPALSDTILSSSKALSFKGIDCGRFMSIASNQLFGNCIHACVIEFA